MSFLSISDLSRDQRREMFPLEKVVQLERFSVTRNIRNEVRKYCEDRNLGEAQIIVCINNALSAHDVAVGKKTADRLATMMSTRRFRHNHFDPPKAS